MKYYTNSNRTMLSYYFRYLGHHFSKRIKIIKFSICCTRTRHYYGMWEFTWWVSKISRKNESIKEWSL